MIPFIIFQNSIKDTQNIFLYSLLEQIRHGQSAALQLFFPAIGPFSVMRKSNMQIFHYKKFGQKLPITAPQGPKKKNSATLILNSVASNKKQFSNLARDQKSLATPGIDVLALISPNKLYCLLFKKPFPDDWPAEASTTDGITRTAVFTIKSINGTKATNLLHLLF